MSKSSNKASHNCRDSVAHNTNMVIEHCHTLIEVSKYQVKAVEGRAV